MSNYILTLIVSNAGGKEVRYDLNLKGLYESYPEDYFQVQENRFTLGKYLEKELFRQINSDSLNYLINQWTDDIKQGIHETTVSLSLPPLKNLPPEKIDSSKKNFPTFIPLEKQLNNLEKDKQEGEGERLNQNYSPQTIQTSELEIANQNGYTNQVSYTPKKPDPQLQQKSNVSSHSHDNHSSNSITSKDKLKTEAESEEKHSTESTENIADF